MVRVEERDGRKNTESVAREVDDVFRLGRRHARDHGVVDVLDRVGATSVLRDTRVFVVGLASREIVRDVLEDRTVADRVEDVGLLLGIETDTFGVAVRG